MSDSLPDNPSPQETGFPVDRAAIPETDLRNALRWAAYLGASWTWVIGMFLPVLLIRDFGPIAWFTFAIPNIVGAAAMGWAIHSRDHSLQLVVHHRVATQMFSLVTIAFHFYMLVWLVPQLVGTIAASIVFGISLLVLIPLLVTSIAQTSLAIVALVASCLLMTIAGGAGALQWPGNSQGAPFDLFALACVCVLGFLTCPYLDLTFHRARQECRTNAESKIAFGVGFGAFFGLMIVFTLFYAWVLISNQTPRGIGALIGTHICLQSLFTIGIHASALRASVDTPATHRRLNLCLWVAILIPVAMALLARGLESRGLILGRFVPGEVGYRLFMSFYGLFAPAYVWLCLHPGRGFLAPYRRELQMFGVAVVVAAPFYWLGFIHGPMAWVLVGVGLVLCARFFLDYTRRDFLAEQRAAMLRSEG